MRTSVEIKKLHLIEEFLKIQDADLINKIEILMNEERLKALELALNQPISEEELNRMIDQAEKDATEGRIFNTKEVQDKIRTWK